MSIYGYPLPSYAAYIWVAGNGDLCMGIPGDVSVKEHVLRFPMVRCQTDNTAATSGFAAMLRILQDRAQAKEPIKIGQPGGITGHQLKELMQGCEVKKVGKREAPADLSLEELGL